MNRMLLKSLCLVSVLLVTGCASYFKQTNLEQVSKDWAMTIRASQVIPLYPMSSDTQPGDIFLVQTPIAQETKIYREKGYLPLDLQIGRLHLSDEFKRFYHDSYWRSDFSGVPFDRPHRNAPVAGTGRLQVHAPSVAFPNYTFEVSTGGGLQVAIPISSVPVGLGIIGAQKAIGSVELNDAYTYGLSVEEVLPKFSIWNAENRNELKRIVEAYPDPIYLRIVTPTHQRIENTSKIPRLVGYGPDENSEKIRRWLKNSETNKNLLTEWIAANLSSSIGISHVINGDMPDVRGKIVTSFNIE